MIEGETPGIAAGRARLLGAGNGFRVGAILIFSYFFMLSLFAALTLPFLVGLYFMGISTDELFTNPLLSVVYTAFQDISSLLALPLWSISFTLLYFDNRVRKEAYDVELLARDVAPGLHWQPTVRESAFGYQMAAVSAHERAYVQTSPLGLAGRLNYQGGPARAERPHAAATPSPLASDNSTSFAPDGGADMKGNGAVTEMTGPPLATCASCGTKTWESTHFCSECGHPFNSQSKGPSE
jgi:ribosomal protein L37E